MQNDLLANPAWHSLQTRQAHLGETRAGAARYRPDISIFGALDTDRGLNAMEPLTTRDDVVVLLSPEGQERAPLDPFEQVAQIRVHQMICQAPTVSAIQPAGVDLMPEHAEQMLALAQLTDPGPFAINTGLMGRYVGVFENGELIAMAGERFRLPGWTEISGVCTSEAARGQGLAKRLIANLMQTVTARGDKAFLHVREGSPSEQAALHAYQQLGFALHQELVGQIFRRVA